jgi:hypothetical protein
MGFLELFAMGWSLTAILPISTSQIVRITDMSKVSRKIMFYIYILRKRGDGVGAVF